MSISSVKDTPLFTPAEIPVAEATGEVRPLEEVPQNIGAGAGEMAFGDEVPLLVTPASASLLSALAATQGSIIEDGDRVTFTSRAQAELILGISLPADVTTNTFMALRNGDGSTSWLPVTLKRTGTGSILNSGQNGVTAEPAGAVITLPGGQTPPFTADAFLAMHSDEQVAAILRFGTVTTSPPSTYLEMTGATAVLDDTHTKAIIVEQLDSRSINTLSAAEQRAVNARPAFSEIKSALGLSTAKPSAVQEAISSINSFPVPTGTSLTQMTESDRNLFIEQLNIIQQKLDKQVFFSTKTVNEEVSAILNRFKTAHAYGSVNGESGAREYSHWKNPDNHSDGTYDANRAYRVDNIISLDKGASVATAYKTFIEQEKRLLELALSRQNTETTISGGKNLDLPSIIFRLQLYYNLQSESLISIKSEEVNQQNELIKTYGYMQQRVSYITSKGKDSSRYVIPEDFHDQGATAFYQFEDRYKDVDDLLYFGMPSMFDSKPVARFNETSVYATQQHPIEALRNITRPSFSFFTDADSQQNSRGQYADYKMSAWSTFGTQLSDTVTLINQETQIQMNAISTLEKEKNRYFEMGNNALSKLNEIIQSIARAV
ncbi:hypothetical protein FHS82_002373 [Pseudochelatococcus lubricantis]|uniref:Flagellar hook-associated protein 1 n=1 Tax=Pseudochelatococcus lubricantis TaxID=1538102 RepID=A0ABX0V3Z6_9HYPH|nr:hypothetical protein [Pseudochelatococcus lubricantis]NIJ58525.1 hypothetical protein [Pseudochelatococcus lubricantis]